MMKEVVSKLILDGKGILAADESSNTINKRFASIRKTPTPENIANYRGMLFTTDGIENYISGVILYEDTINTCKNDAFCFGKSVVDHLIEKNIIAGVKVDKGTIRHPNNVLYKITSGLDDLENRLLKFKMMGCTFAKWRAVIDGLSNNFIPEKEYLETLATHLAQYASICQQNEIVPIIEPELLLENNAVVGFVATTAKDMLRIVFDKLLEWKVDLSCMLLKTNMIMSGYTLGRNENPAIVATNTLNVLRDVVPVSVQGIVFLSGGQTSEQATKNLNAINQQKGNCPWKLSFSYGRALQQEALALWGEDKYGEAQEAFLNRAKQVGYASIGAL